MFEQSIKLKLKFADTGVCVASEGQESSATAVEPGNTFNLSCIVPRLPTPELTWVRDNVTMTTEILLVESSDIDYSRLDLSVTDFAEEDAGLYRCVASYLDASVDVCDVVVSSVDTKRNGETLQKVFVIK